MVVFVESLNVDCHRFCLWITRVLTGKEREKQQTSKYVGSLEH